MKCPVMPRRQPFDPNKKLQAATTRIASSPRSPPSHGLLAGARAAFLPQKGGALSPGSGSQTWQAMKLGWAASNQTADLKSNVSRFRVRRASRLTYKPD